MTDKTKWISRLAAAGFFVAAAALGYIWQQVSMPQVSLAQSGTVSNHAVPIGKGAGTTGFGSALPGASGQVLTSTGTSSDPTFQALSFATQPQYYQGTSNNTIIAPSIIYPSETTTTYGTTTSFDFSTFINTAVTLSGGNITTMNVSNVTAGKAGTITFIQDSGGSRTTVWNSVFKFSGGSTPTLTTTANAVDVLSYSCRSATFCAASLIKDVR